MMFLPLGSGLVYNANAMSQAGMLSVRTLGHFRVWRQDGTEITISDWGREKARTLCQYLVTRRRVLTPKERMAFDLWPDLDGRRADRDFRVALNALMRALEPHRQPRADSGFIQRQGTAYGLVPALWDVDADRFVELVKSGARAESRDPDLAVGSYRAAVDLYHGDYLPDALYQDWASGEREHLLTLFLSSASRLAELLLESRDDQEAIALAETVLSRDPCWEEAYRVLMRAYERRGNRPQAIRVYQRCETALREELGLAPMPETIKLYRQIKDREKQ
jgi:LuxR family maltose regulon positive regulatory protein